MRPISESAIREAAERLGRAARKPARVILWRRSDEIVGLHGQQAAEKLLEAAPAAHKIDFPRTHSAVAQR